MFEVLLILANLHPTNPISSQIITLLVRSSAPNAVSRIRLTPLFLLGWFCNLIGAALRYYCYQIMGDLFTFELSIRKDHTLITSGPYSFVRHPSYTGALIAALGTVMCYLSNGSWFVECSGWIVEGNGVLGGLRAAIVGILLIALVSRTRKEDEMLKRQFDKQWEDWSKMVPYRLIPGLY